MNIENEIFKKAKVNKNKLLQFGFIKENDLYRYSKKFMNNSFRADIYVDAYGKVEGRVIELELNEEYTNFRMPNALGEFVNTVKEKYIQILQEIVEKCCEKENFIFPQTNRITQLIKEKYNVSPEFLWDSTPDCGVFRNARSNKWFGIIMYIDKSKIIAEETGKIEVLNIKLDELVSKYLNTKGIYPSYHMNKKSWVSIILDDTLPDEELMKLIDISYEFANVSGEWIVPANPKYYDVINAFNDTDVITWKQSNNIAVHDIVYLYVAQPYSAILYKCEVLEVDIPYEYADKNLTIKKVMKIKLLKRYNKDEFTFEKLNEYGIRAIRGPRGVPANLNRALNKN